MQVVTTAGHGGHGKSALVRALTGGDAASAKKPEEPGAWTELPSGRRVAFVDVPGGERDVPAMLAGAAPAPAVLLCVAADEGWMPRSQEHLDVLGALGVRFGVLAVTRSDAADPKLALRQARERLAGTPLRGVETVAVSARTGAGMGELAAALDRLAGRLPVPDPDAPVRLWIDHAFTAGRQSVVTGTLTAGTITVGDELLLMPAGERVRVRTIGCAGEPHETVGGVSRVVLTLREAGRVGPGMALVAAGAWTHTTCVDVRTRFGEASGRLARRMTLHLGSAAVPVRLRPLGPDTARLTLNSRLALHLGDTGVLRDPERRSIAGVSVLDLRPPTLVRRGAGAARARELASWPDRPDGAIVLRRHGVLRRAELSMMGCAPPDGAVALDGGWLADPAHWESLFERLAEETARHAAGNPDAPGIPLETVRLRLGLPARQLVEALVRPPLRVENGRVHGPAAARPAWAVAVERLRAELAGAPFAAPAVDRLAELGLTGDALAAAERAGAVVRIPGDADGDGDEIVLMPGTDREALRVLSGLPQPFTPGQAGDALGTSRRVAVALLRHLDGLGLTERRRS
ncbi:selenocysteine-specific translation elongation factor [Actinomadura sp. KC216]|uniref:selenocysteine-specific translation elongation factor n=1 Tax=Actinomadura sp. KC216 TaxID=2530370 RepID=UPI00104D470C|nr:selenocysteine-specific translation elongation factor [Actinomadura sp. KC216]TDB79799.1 selenocysteine-specific translation elongation factor [Actinomadura sp. KC216]